jgi:biotin carboxylase
MQLPAIRAARRLGLYVFVADGNPNAIGRKEADEFLSIDLKDLDGMAEAAVRLKKSRGLHAVFTAGTDFSATVAYAAEAAGLPGTPYESAVAATDKYQMREVLRDAGVRVPDFVLIRAEELSSGLPPEGADIELPVVVKPADSMGARGVVRADDWSSAYRYAKEAANYSRSGRVVIEGYIDGPEFSLDAIVYGDSVQITGFADRLIQFPPYFIETGHTIPTALPDGARQAVEQEFIRGVKALGIGPGAAKGDMKLSSHGPVVGEIANRLSGGYMSGWTYPLSSGVALTELGIRVSLGQAPGTIRQGKDWTSAERALLSIDGVVVDILGAGSAKAEPFVEEVFPTCEPGQRVRFPQNNVEKAANVISAAPSRQEATDAAERAVSLLTVRLQPDNAETDVFLFGGSGVVDEHWAYPESAAVLFGTRPSLPLSGSETIADAYPEMIELPVDLSTLDELDWSYRTIAGTIDMLATFHDSETQRAIASGSRVISVRFLIALLKGGLQGALYVLDSGQTG